MNDDDDDEKPSLVPMSAAERDAVESTVAQYQAGITKDVADYLKSRGIDRHTAERFRIGACIDPRPGDERHYGSLVMPYLDREGRALTYRFRCIQDHNHRDQFHGKYSSRKADPPRTFNVRAIFDATDTINVTEGEFDAMILTKIGLPAVAVPGAKHWTPHRARMLAGFSKVRMWADADEAGMDLLRRIQRSLHTVHGVYLPTGSDVSALYVESGPEALLDLAA